MEKRDKEAVYKAADRFLEQGFPVPGRLKIVEDSHESYSLIFIPDKKEEPEEALKSASTENADPKTFIFFNPKMRPNSNPPKAEIYSSLLKESEKGLKNV